MRWLWLALCVSACGGEAERADAHGVAVWLTGVTVERERNLTIQIEADDLSFEVGAAPTYRVVPRDAHEAVVPRRTPLDLHAGDNALHTLVVFIPEASGVDVTLRALDDDQVVLDQTVRFDGSTPTVSQSGITLHFDHRTEVPPIDDDRLIGLHTDGPIALPVAGPIAVKVYSGTRRWFLADDFSGLEADMETTALAAALKVSDDVTRARVHWVFKRSLGGSSRCDDNGEVDVTPETYARFFEAAMRAATAVNARHETRLIDILSPMNEANHPLQDGAHHNSAGQSSIGGLLSFVDAIAQASCSNGDCCDADAYIVPDPDVPALLAAALDAAAPLADLPFAPRIGLSLYLDTEQVDPLQSDSDGNPPAIVTPVRAFLDTLALEPSVLRAMTLVVDTYPGSWGAPWFETPDRIVHHMDPELARIVRVDPVIAADQAVARALRAKADAGDVAAIVLGEVGWSTFDGDDQAQARFARRLFDAFAAEPELDGFLWFKSNDRSAFVYPTWTSATNPVGGDPIDCGLEPLGTIVCAADVLAKMEGQWGLMRKDGSEKPALAAFIARWQRMR